MDFIDSRANKIIELSLALFDPNFNLRTQHFSFIFLKSRLIAIGRNSAKTNPTNLLNPRIGDTGRILADKGTCSELAACLKLKNLTNIPTEKCDLFNVRVNNNSQISLSAPCQSCNSLLRYFKFKNVYFTDNQGRIQRANFD